MHLCGCFVVLFVHICIAVRDQIIKRRKGDSKIKTPIYQFYLLYLYASSNQIQEMDFQQPICSIYELNGRRLDVTVSFVVIG